MQHLRVGFVGIGTMDRPMANQIAQAEFPLCLFDIDAAASPAVAAETGATIGSSPKAVAEASDVVITMLPGGRDVHAVTLGQDGLVEGFGPDAVLIDMSSSEPSGTAALSVELVSRGVAMIDAPVSGGQAKALDGTLTLMVGGDDDVIDRCMPVLEAMGDRIFRTGAVGSGHAIKAINNLLNAAGLLAAGEALLIGRRFGLDDQVMLDVVNASTGMNHATQHKFERWVLSGRFDSGFSLDLMVKDLEIALGLARDTGTTAAYATLCRDLWAAAQRYLGEGRDHTELVRWLESDDPVAFDRDAR